MSVPDADWESDEQLVLTFFRRRWAPELEDLIEGSRGDELAFDDLDLDADLDELTNAVSNERLRRFAAKGLAHGDAFVRLLAVNLAFAFRTDELLQALVESTRSGPAPRLSPRDLGALLGRARAVRRARELVSSLPEEKKTAALAAIEPMLVPGDWSVLHARATTDELGEAVERVISKRSLVSVPWVRAPQALRFVATRRRGGWATLLSGAGIERELAVELSAILGKTAWAEKKGEATRFALLEQRRLLDEQTEPDEVGGALRALGITAHDTKAPGKVVSLAFEHYAPPGENSPARLRKLSALGLAFLPPDQARKAKARGDTYR